MAKILLIEDDPDSADMLGMLLAFQGHAIAYAQSGRAGMALASTFLPDIVIVDLVLPDVDGIAVIADLRTASTARRFLILALSNASDPETRLRADLAGVDHFFAKGDDVGTLLALVAAHTPPSS